MQRPASFRGDEASWQKSCSDVVNLAQAILDGKVGLIAGARKLSAQRFDLKAEADPDFIFLVGVDSETDDLPSGETSKHWNPAALQRKQQEIDRAEELYRPKALIVCRNLISKYQAPPQ